jgi:hypothetical protein
MTRTISIVLLAALVAIVGLAAVSRGAAPEAWAAYEAQVETDCRAALEQQGLAISALGDVAHGSDDVGSFTMFAAGVARRTFSAARRAARARSTSK